MLLQLRLGLRAFEWLPFPRRFSRLDQAGRERFLASGEPRAGRSNTTCC